MTTEGITEAVTRLRKIYEDAYHGIINGTEDADEIDEVLAKREATNLALGALPLLNSKHACSVYIACVAWLYNKKLIDKEDQKAHLYTAQVALQSLAAQPKPTQQQQKGKVDASKKKQPRSVR